ncbi:hypothetical protein K438DRAFT_1764802 [Mycena galopus ATCC 62051]|nr:hypothetical protein K438DRAFT_1764802 [Mycena galopus ATCC 62051]
MAVSNELYPIDPWAFNRGRGTEHECAFRTTPHPQPGGSTVSLTRHRVTTHEKIFTAASDSRHRASARDLSLMAIYYEYYDYGDDDPTFSDFQEASDDWDPHYDDAAYRGYYEQYDSYVCENSPTTLYPDESYAYEDAGGDGDCMEIAYGEPGYWEEYHWRRYEIIYGTDVVEEVVSTDPPDNDGGLVYSEPEAYEGAHDSADNYAAVYGDKDGLVVDSVAAWETAWDIGPSITENELAWAEAMEEWRQRLVAEQERAGSDVLHPHTASLSTLYPANDYYVNRYSGLSIYTEDEEYCRHHDIDHPYDNCLSVPGFVAFKDSLS